MKENSEIFSCLGSYKEPFGDLRFECRSFLVIHPCKNLTIGMERDSWWYGSRGLSGRDEEHKTQGYSVASWQRAAERMDLKWRKRGCLPSQPSSSSIWSLCHLHWHFPSFNPEWNVSWKCDTGIFYLWCCHFLFSIFLENTTSGERSGYLPLISPLKTGRGKRTPLIVSDKHRRMWYPREQEKARFDCFATR